MNATIPKEVLDPFIEFVRVNDSDTLSRLRPDETVIATATGSWSNAVDITLGQLRALVRAAC